MLTNIIKNALLKSSYCKNLFNRSSFACYSSTTETKLDDSSTSLDEKFELYLKNVSNQSQVPFAEKSLEEKRQIIDFEHRLAKEMGEPVPSELTDRHYKKLLKEPSIRRVKETLKFLLRIDIKRLKEREEKEDKRKFYKEKRKSLETIEHSDTPITSYPGYHTIFGHIMDIPEFYTNRLLTAFRLDNPKIVIDFGFSDDIKNSQQFNSLISQISYLYASNKYMKDPFQLYFCNLNQNKFHIDNIDRLVVEATEKSYLNLFDRNKLVYLSPDAPNVMKSYDPENIYILGAINDKGFQGYRKLTLTKSVKEGIRCERLPLEQHVKWATGDKTLCVNQVLEILGTLKDTGDWKKAFKAIPQRKIQKDDASSQENEQQTRQSLRSLSKKEIDYFKDAYPNLLKQSTSTNKDDNVKKSNIKINSSKNKF